MQPLRHRHGRVHHQHHGVEGGVDDGGEVPHGVIGQPRQQRRVHHMRGRAEEQGVAIRRLPARHIRCRCCCPRRVGSPPLPADARSRTAAPASARARMSVGPPGAKGTMRRTGRSGQAWAWARASPGMASSPAPASSALRDAFILVLLSPTHQPCTRGAPRRSQALICTAEMRQCTTTGRSFIAKAFAIPSPTSDSSLIVKASAPKARPQAAKSGLVRRARP